MIETLYGKVTLLRSDHLCLETHGIGYQIYTYSNLLRKVRLEQETRFFTSLIFREEKIYLYGFIDIQEKLLFELLLEAQGVGPKVALAIFDAASLEEIMYAIQANKPSILKAASGVGEKMAQRIILDCEAKLKKLFSYETGDFATAKKPLGEPSTKLAEEILLTLQALGYSTAEIQRCVPSALSEDQTFEENLKKCLKQLRK